MAIQILGLRYFADQKTGKMRTHECYFNKEWRAPSVKHLFENIEEHLAKIPEKEHYNLFYTSSHCLEERGRKFEKQDIIPFDIDGIDTERITDYYGPVLEGIGNAHYDNVGVVHTGNGLQVIVQLDYVFEDVKYFDEMRAYYGEICMAIDKKLQQAGLPGSADPVVWSKARLLRLPMTKNIKTPETGYKKKNSTKDAVLVQRHMEPFGFNLITVSGITPVDKKDCLDDKSVKKLFENYGSYDKDYILNECSFLKHLKDNQESGTVTEQEWYHGLTILGRLGEDVARDYSESDPRFDEDVFSQYLRRATDPNVTGPLTCLAIEEKNCFDCSSCPHHGKVASPIVLKSKSHIGTKKTGFRKVKFNKAGIPTEGEVHYEDLLKYFRQQHEFIVTSSGSLYLWRDSHWEHMPDVYIDSFCEKNIKEAPNSHECKEFKNKIFRNNIRDDTWFDRTTFRKVNLANGVLDIGGDEPVLLAHSTDMGFKSVLPYEYDPTALCPRFDQFLGEITCERDKIGQLLLEYAAYIIANESCTHAKCLILLGEGRNGKSTFMNVIKSLLGKDFYQSVPLARLTDEKYLAELHGKLVNICEETPSRKKLDSYAFKNLISGGDVHARRLYKHPFIFQNRTKIMIASNDLPWMGDNSQGFQRRLLIVPFDGIFEGAGQDVDIESKLHNERAGILNKVIAAYKVFKDRGRFIHVHETDEQMEEYLGANDHIKDFVEECMYVLKEEDQGYYSSKVSNQDLFEHYMRYCISAGIPKNEQHNRLSLIRNALPKQIKGLKFRRYVKNSERGFRGITLINDSEI